MKKLLVAMTMFFCIGTITYMITKHLETNKKYYVVSLYSFHDDEVNGIENTLKEIEKIGKIENKIRTSCLVFVSSFKPIEIEKEKEKNKNIEEIKEIKYYKTGSHAKYDIVIQEKNKKIIQQLEKEIPIIHMENLSSQRKILLHAVLTEGEFIKLNNNHLIEKIELHSEIWI